MDDLTGKINSLLSDPDSMEKIKNLASMFTSSSGESESNTQRKENNDDGGGFNIDPAMLFKVKGALDVMKKDDPRISLLLALKPNLSEVRRNKVDEAIHILRLLSLMPLLRDQGFL